MGALLHCVHIEARGQLWSGFFLPTLHGFLGLNHQACVTGTHTAETSHQPPKIVLYHSVKILSIESL